MPVPRIRQSNDLWFSDLAHPTNVNRRCQHWCRKNASKGFVAAIILLISGLGLASGISTAVVERTRELGVLRALGATPGAVYRLLSVETLVTALGGCLLAIVLSDPVSRWLEYTLGTGIVEYPFDHKLSMEGIVLGLVIVSGVALLATVAPARMISKQAIRQAISYE